MYLCNAVFFVKMESGKEETNFLLSSWSEIFDGFATVGARHAAPLLLRRKTIDQFRLELLIRYSALFQK
jgi:hypothetical protein